MLDALAGQTGWADVPFDDRLARTTVDLGGYEPATTSYFRSGVVLLEG